MVEMVEQVDQVGAVVQESIVEIKELVVEVELVDIEVLLILSPLVVEHQQKLL
jgi:hypothetical protein